MTAMDDAWQDIATAPKDKRIWVIQMTDGDYAQAQCGACWFIHAWENWVPAPFDHNIRFRKTGISEYWQCDLSGLLPTHWQPLPAPPVMLQDGDSK